VRYPRDPQRLPRHHGGEPGPRPPDSTVRVVCNDYEGLASCGGGYVVKLLGSGSEVYEDLTGRPDLSVFGDPTTNTIVTDYCCECDRPRRG